MYRCLLFASYLRIVGYWLLVIYCIVGYWLLVICDIVGYWLLVIYVLFVISC